MFIKMCDLDSMRHTYGVYSKEAYKQLKKHDLEFGKILETIKRYGDFENTNFVIMGDHGQTDIEESLNMNKLLQDNGFIRSKDDYDCIAHSFCLTCNIELKDPTDKKMHDKVKEFLWLEYTYQEINLSDNYFYFYSKSNNQIDVSWYNTLYMLDDLYQKDGEWDNIFMIDFEDWNHETIDLKPYLNDLYNVSNVFKETFTGEYFIIEEDNKKIILTSVNWEKQRDEIIITSIYWYLLTR